MSFRVRDADWERDMDALKDLRRAVFVVEQDVPEVLEWDGVDGDCRHAIAEDDTGRVIGCARLLVDGHIGRVAVLADWRGKGVGDALMRHMIALARSLGHHRVMLNAQTHALRFYERHGFAAVGDEYDDAGIAHRAMERVL
ncbi:MAG: GNAT family N-acetyltransferase [Betaproteobacteria bacterium]